MCRGGYRDRGRGKGNAGHPVAPGSVHRACPLSGKRTSLNTSQVFAGSARRSLDPEGLLPTGFGDREPVGRRDQVRAVVEEEVKEEVELPGVVALRIDLDGDAAGLQHPAGRRLRDQQVERPGVGVVVEVPELVGDAGHDRLIHQADGDLDSRVVVLVLVVGVKGHAGPGQDRIVSRRHAAPPGSLYSIPNDCCTATPGDFSCTPLARASRCAPSSKRRSTTKLKRQVSPWPCGGKLAWAKARMLTLPVRSWLRRTGWTMSKTNGPASLWSSKWPRWSDSFATTVPSLNRTSTSTRVSLSLSSSLV